MAPSCFAFVCLVVVLPSVAGWWWSNANQNQNLNNNVNVNTGFYDPPPAPAPEPPAPKPKTAKTVVHSTKDTVVSINFHAPIKNKFVPTLNIGGIGGAGPAPKSPSASPKKKSPKKAPKKGKRPQPKKKTPSPKKKSKAPKQKAPKSSPPKGSPGGAGAGSKKVSGLPMNLVFNNNFPQNMMNVVGAHNNVRGKGVHMPNNNAGGTQKVTQSYRASGGIQTQGGAQAGGQGGQQGGQQQGGGGQGGYGRWGGSRYTNIKAIKYPSNDVQVIGNGNEVHTVAGLYNNVKYQKKVVPKPNPMQGMQFKLLLNLLQKMVVKVNHAPQTTPPTDTTTTTTTEATTTPAETTTTTEATTTTTEPTTTTTTEATTTTTEATTTTTTEATTTPFSFAQNSMLLEALLAQLTAGSNVQTQQAAVLDVYGRGGQKAVSMSANSGAGHQATLDILGAAQQGPTTPPPYLDPVAHLDLLAAGGSISGAYGTGAGLPGITPAPAGTAGAVDLTWLNKYMPQLALHKRAPVKVISGGYGKRKILK